MTVDLAKLIERLRRKTQQCGVNEGAPVFERVPICIEAAEALSRLSVVRDADAKRIAKLEAEVDFQRRRSNSAESGWKGDIERWQADIARAETAERALAALSRERLALFKCAASCQGGHSDAGDAAADALGIPFPITMSNLISKAREEGLNPRDVWPWAYRSLKSPGGA